MDTLVSIGSLAAFGWSLYALFVGGAGLPSYVHPFHVALSWSGGRPDLSGGGRRRHHLRAGRPLRGGQGPPPLRGCAARVAHVGAKDAAVLRDGREVRVPAEQLGVGDRFVVRPGEKVATDGVVVEGGSALDLSMITGEPLPVDAAAGVEVTGGCVAVDGRLVVRATRVGGDTRLAQMAAMVEAAQTRKAAGTAAGRPGVRPVRPGGAHAGRGHLGVLAGGRTRARRPRSAPRPRCSSSPARARSAWPPRPRCSWAPVAAPSWASSSPARRCWNRPGGSTPSCWTRPAP